MDAVSAACALVYVPAADAGGTPDAALRDHELVVAGRIRYDAFPNLRSGQLSVQQSSATHHTCKTSMSYYCEPARHLLD